MHRIDGYGATPDNKFTEGDPAQSVPATDVTDDWLNDQQENVCAVIEGAGIALVKGDYTQLYKAIQNLVGMGSSAMRRVEASGSVATTDRIILIDASLGAVDLTLFAASDANARGIRVMRIDDTGNQVRLLPSGAGQTIAWETSIELTIKGESYEFIPDGVNNYLQF